MKHFQEPDYEDCVQRHFDCDKPMAKLIIQSYKANNNFERIQQIYERERSRANGNK